MPSTRLHLAVMDSSRPGVEVEVPLEPLGLPGRAWRGLKRMLLVSGVGVVVALVPLLHGCGLVTALLAGPVAGLLAFLPRVVLGPCVVACPKCAVSLEVPAGTTGWPARVHCGACGAMAELRPLPAP